MPRAWTGLSPTLLMQTEFVQAGRVRLQAFCHGSGPHVLVLVHGYRASGRVWRRAVTACP